MAPAMVPQPVKAAGCSLQWCLCERATRRLLQIGLKRGDETPSRIADLAILVLVHALEACICHSLIYDCFNMQVRRNVFQDQATVSETDAASES